MPLIFQHKTIYSQDIWHGWFGHLGVQTIRKLANETMVDGLNCNITTDTDLCEPCIGGKHHKSPFPKSSSSHSKNPLNLVHSDVCGKMGEKSMGGAEYFLTFVDDKTRYVWVYLLKKKSDVFEKFKLWKTMAEKSSGCILITLRTDNGGEFISTQFGRYLCSEGIQHELTIPKTPQQNGVAKRLNKTLLEKVRSMLIDQKVPHSFWAEALVISVYLKNRSPTSFLDRQTPFEAWKGKKPDVGHLHDFGCGAYVHVSKDEQRKLDSNAKKFMFLGYGEETKGYLLNKTR